GRHQTLMIGTNGLVYGTGWNTSGQLTGTGNKASFTALSGLPPGLRAVGIAAGQEHTLIVGTNGSAYGTGYNYHGQITGAVSRSTLLPLSIPSDVGKVVKVAAGTNHTFALTDRGFLLGTGNNVDHQVTGTGERRTLTHLAGAPVVGALP